MKTFTDFVNSQPHGYMATLSVKTGLHPNTISSIYSGKRRASSRSAAILAAVCDLTVDQVYGSFKKEE